MREYINAVEAAARAEACPLDPEEGLDNWLKWAREQADRLDPLTISPSSILDDADEKIEAPPSPLQRTLFIPITAG